MPAMLTVPTNAMAEEIEFARRAYDYLCSNGYRPGHAVESLVAELEIDLRYVDAAAAFDSLGAEHATAA